MLNHIPDAEDTPNGLSEIERIYSSLGGLKWIYS